jgi:hypothetical protein
MSETILASIISRGDLDAFNAFKLSSPDSMNSSYTVSDVSVTESFVGYIYAATIRVIHKLLFVKNTTIHRIELIYGLDGTYRQVKSLTTISEHGLGLNL